MTEIKFVNAEVLKVGPDEVLIIKIGETSDVFDDGSLLNDLNELLAEVGLKDRSLILMGDDIEFTVVEKSQGIAPDYADSAE